MSNNISIQKTDVNLLEYIVDGEKICYETFIDGNDTENEFYDIFLTNFRILVIGSNNSVSIPYSQIADIETYESNTYYNEQLSNYREFGRGDYSIVLRMNYSYEWIFRFFMSNLEHIVIYKKIVYLWLNK